MTIIMQCVRYVSAMDLPAVREAQVRSLGDPLEKEMATHSGILAWRIPCTEEPGRLQSMGSQRVRHDYETNTMKEIKMVKTWERGRGIICENLYD